MLLLGQPAALFFELGLRLLAFLFDRRLLPPAIGVEELVLLRLVIGSACGSGFLGRGLGGPGFFADSNLGGGGRGGLFGDSVFGGVLGPGPVLVRRPRLRRLLEARAVDPGRGGWAAPRGERNAGGNRGENAAG